ncbi:YdcF family protein [Lacticaseibacillus mingshuiensis]|uniref:YdcF family protein n=1 Tax=Lacticaseibacillus mingshuiensis TaxID=2799574 RepID=A0ABW4CK30_9LACO|nr:YdcF family protein [Lacticaseibacillus mingshuiensis]
MSPITWGLLALFSVFSLLFGFSFGLEPRRLLNGWLFTGWLLALLALAADVILESGNMLLIAVTGTLFVIFVLVISVIFALHLVWLLWNAFVVWRREGHSLGNMLTLLLAAGLLLLELGATIGRQYLPDPLYNALGFFFVFTIAYELLSLYNFLTVLVLYNLVRPRHNKDYLIVLGAGLLNGDQVSPLLAARINVGIRFFNKQVKRGKKRPKLLFSGGQGADEKLPEGLAMQRYAIKQGVAPEDTLVEDRSTTTLENMRDSAAVIAQENDGAPYKAAFFTNNYHLFRAGLYAKEAGLRANGVGAETSFYFLPNAVIREYLALVMMHKRSHLVILGLITLGAILTFIGGAL